MAVLKDTKFVTVTVENRSPESEEKSTFVGGNMVIIDGTPNIKHYTIELGKEVSLPEHFVQQLKDRSHVVQDAKTKKNKLVPLFIVK